MGRISRVKRELRKKYPGGLKDHFRTERRLTERLEQRREWALTIGIGIVAALLVWEEQGVTAAWIAVLVIVGLGLEFGLFLGLLFLAWSLIDRNPSRDLLRRVVLLGSAAALLHVLSPTPMGIVTRIAAASAGVAFTVVKIFRYW